jgi:hypothetical protein
MPTSRFTTFYRCMLWKDDRDNGGNRVNVLFRFRDYSVFVGWNGQHEGSTVVRDHINLNKSADRTSVTKPLAPTDREFES